MYDTLITDAVFDQFHPIREKSMRKGEEDRDRNIAKSQLLVVRNYPSRDTQLRSIVWNFDDEKEGLRSPFVWNWHYRSRKYSWCASAR